MVFRHRYIMLLLLGVIMLLCAFSYIYIPDNTPDANNMHPELMLQKPGFKMGFIDTVKEATISGNFFTGYTKPGVQIPVSTFIQRYESTRYNVYKGAGLPPDTLVWKAPKLHISYTTFLLGTDAYGRDMFSRLVLGMRNSLIIGFIAVLVSLIVGVGIGVTAGYYSGAWDSFSMWLINVIWSLPTLLIVFGLTLALGKGFWQVFLAVGLTMWVETARVVRAETLSLKKRDFVSASYVLGRANRSIILKHIIPNIWPIIWVLAANNFAAAMLVESGLSFLGLGIQPPSPTLGSLLEENYGFIVTQHAYLAFMPGITLMVLVLMFYQAGVSLKSNNRSARPYGY